MSRFLFVVILVLAFLLPSANARKKRVGAKSRPTTLRKHYKRAKAKVKKAEAEAKKAKRQMCKAEVGKAVAIAMIGCLKEQKQCIIDGIACLSHSLSREGLWHIRMKKLLALLKAGDKYMNSRRAVPKSQNRKFRSWLKQRKRVKKKIKGWLKEK